MAKDPSVLLYTQDFLVGIAMFSPAQIGHYIKLLCHQQQSATGSLTIGEIESLMQGDFEKLWPTISKKFMQDENGFFNLRMRSETTRRKKYSESRANNRKKEKPETYEKHMNNISDSYEKHMETENENENKKEKGVPKPSAEKPESPAKKVFRFVPPTQEQVEDYFVEKGFSKVLAKQAFDYYADADPPWTDRNGDPVRSWKSKMVANWLTQKHKNEENEQRIANSPTKRQSNWVSPADIKARERAALGELAEEVLRRNAGPRP